MLTVLVETASDAEELAATLSSLVPGAVEGLVREAILIEGTADEAARRVADHAGCRLVPLTELRQAIALAKGEWLLLLEPGARLQPGWMEAVAEHLEIVARGRGQLGPARFTPARIDRPGFLRRLTVRRSALADGLLAPKALMLGRAGQGANLADMAKGLATTRLGAEIRPPRRRR